MAARGRGRGIGRRALFFWLASLVCLALVPATPADLRYVTWGTIVLGVFWAVLLSVEDLLSPGPSDRPVIRPVGQPTRPSVHDEGTPFQPPPPPRTEE
jgi:hypothetical protein